jgi:hypothetical protein
MAPEVQSVENEQEKCPFVVIRAVVLVQAIIATQKSHRRGRLRVDPFANQE